MALSLLAGGRIGNLPGEVLAASSLPEVLCRDPTDMSHASRLVMYSLALPANVANQVKNSEESRAGPERTLAWTNAKTFAAFTPVGMTRDAIMESTI